MTRFRRAAVLASLLAVVAAAGAIAATTSSRPAGSPDLAAMALAASDFPVGARVTKEGYYVDKDFVAAFEREIDVGGARVGRSRILEIDNDLSVETSAGEAQGTFAAAKALVASKSFRNTLKKEFVKEFTKEAGFKPSSITIGAPRTARIGDGAFSVLIRLKAKGIAIDVALTFMRVDRVLGIVTFVGVPNGRVSAATVDRVDRVAVAHMRAGLVAVNTSPPTLAGTPQPGQVLTASAGTWGGDQVAFTYQWRRCDPSGAGCVDIPGATAATYTVATGDLGSTLRVAVVGANRFGSAPALSTQTALVVGPPGSPVVTALPTISGTAQQGQTLSASTGTWSGDPTTFAYQWRHCDAAGTTCVDIAGATGSTYVVQPSDAGATIRVLVVATNAVGPSGAISAQTAVVT